MFSNTSLSASDVHGKGHELTVPLGMDANAVT